MDWIPQIFRRRKIYSDLSEEIRLGIEERSEQLVLEGMSSKQAAREARLAFGSAHSWRSAAAKCGNGPQWSRSPPMCG